MITHQNTFCFSLSRQLESPQRRRLQRRLSPRPDTQSRSPRMLCMQATCTAKVPSGVCASRASSGVCGVFPGLWSPAAGACVRASLCAEPHPYCNPTPPCDVLAAPVTSGPRVLPMDPPTPPSPTPPPVLGCTRRCSHLLAWTNHGSREALTSPETWERAEWGARGVLLKREGVQDAPSSGMGGPPGMDQGLPLKLSSASRRCHLDTLASIFSSEWHPCRWIPAPPFAHSPQVKTISNAEWDLSVCILFALGFRGSLAVTLLVMFIVPSRDQKKDAWGPQRE